MADGFFEREPNAAIHETRMTPSAERRSAKGSFEPVGFSSIAQKVDSKSILSASATATETGAWPAMHRMARAANSVP